MDAAPAILDRAADRSRDLGRRIDTVVGDNGPLYLLAGAIGLVGLGLFAVSQTRSGSGSATRSQAKRPAARRARRAPAKRTVKAKTSA